jgi:IS30 family transposase
MAHKHLSDNDRFYIEKRRAEGDSLRKIALGLGYCHTTLSREVRRHTPDDFNGRCCLNQLNLFRVLRSDPL